MKTPLKGTGPNLPSYYRDGGRVLAVAEIEPANDVGVYGKRGEATLDAELAEAGVRLAEASALYEATAGAEWEPFPLSAAHARVSYFKGRILTLRRMLGAFPRQRGLFGLTTSDPEGP